jgi:excinuclease ABC subunit C
MTSQEVKKLNLPDKPGVYFFKQGREIVYIGKATSLRDRVRSYFVGDIGEVRGPKIGAMLEQANKLEWQATDSVLEALLLETELIKKHQPKYNSREKDDKSYWHVVITKEDFPRVLMLRAKDLKAGSWQLKAVFGPFPSSKELKEALKIIRRIFPYRDKCLPRAESRGEYKIGRPCFNRQLGLCPGVCMGEISKTDYAKTIRNLKLFFQGKKGAVVKNLEQEMKRLAKAREFERAAKIRNQIFALNHIRDVSLIGKSAQRTHLKKSLKGESFGQEFRIEAYDIAHTGGKEVVGVMTVVVAGAPAKGEYRKFKIKEDRNDDVANLREIISRRLGHPEWPAPGLVVVDGGRAQLKAVEAVLAEAGVIWPAVAVIKDERHRARQILGDKSTVKNLEADIILANAEAHRFGLKWHRERRGRLGRGRNLV